MNSVTHQLTVSYDLSDDDDENIEVGLQLLDENNIPITSCCTDIVGDIGFPVKSGTGKKIVVNWGLLEALSKTTRVKIIADDHYKIDIQALVNEVSINELQSNVTKVAIERHQLSDKGRQNITTVRDYIEERFKQTNKNSSRQIVKQGNEVEVQNIISTENGNAINPELVILGAHYDAVKGSSGADDNASGVAGMIEIQRILSKHNFKNTVKFIAFDMEEAGFVGSVTYLKNGVRKDEKIRAMLNLDMIGYYDNKPNTQQIPRGYEIVFPEVVRKVEENGRRGDFILSIANENSKPLADHFENMANLYVPALKVISIYAFQVGQLSPELASSDHKGFWHTGRMAIHLSDGAETRNPQVNTKNDVQKDINYEFMANVVKGALATIVTLAEIQHSYCVTMDTDGKILE